MASRHIVAGDISSTDVKSKTPIYISRAFIFHAISKEGKL